MAESVPVDKPRWLAEPEPGAPSRVKKWCAHSSLGLDVRPGRLTMSTLIRSSVSAGIPDFNFIAAQNVHHPPSCQAHIALATVGWVAVATGSLGSSAEWLRLFLASN